VAMAYIGKQPAVKVEFPGPLTNLALAIERDSSFATKVKRRVILSGAFFSLGIINPAVEANV
ncbi:inosine/uridine-preferring nucleoside hydrolase domain-containing protein, partial [Tanacetum coccineum]